MTRSGLDAVRDLARHYCDVAGSLTATEWQRPSRCDGWSVQDLVAHTGSNFRVLVEPPPPPPADAPPLTAEQGQDLLVEARRGWPAADVLAELQDYRAGALDVLGGMQEEPVASAPLTLADLGTYPAHRLADAFAFDLWCHLTVDLLAPSGPVGRRPVEATDALLAPGVGWMLAGLPQMCPAVAGLLDRPLGLLLTGPGGGSWVLRPGEPVVVEPAGDLDAGADVPAVVESAATAFVLWGTTRSPWREHVRLSGDESYAAAVLDRVNIV